MHVTREGPLRSLLRRIFAWIDRRPKLARVLERAELAVKRPMFGCQACGNCVLGHLEYVCPQTCPKQMRNGSGGGTDRGTVRGRRQALYVGRRLGARRAGRADDLRTYIPPPDRSLTSTSSWINYFLGRDNRPRG